MIDTPKFLVADDNGDRDFVVHCHTPRFILEIDDDGVGRPIMWLDPPPETASGVARLMREAGDFYLSTLE